MKEDDPPKVFISYSWDNIEHRSWVRFLAERLRANGVDTRLDQWHVKAGESFTRFMEEEVIASDFVLAVCTPTFAKKSNSRQGGAGYEQQIVSGLLVSGSPRSKFIPIIRSGEYEIGPNCAIPTHFAGIVTIDFRHDEEFKEGFEELLRVIFDRPRFAPPPLGKSPSLSTIQYTVVPVSSEQLNQNNNVQHAAEDTISFNRPEKQTDKQEFVPSEIGKKIYRAELIQQWLKEHIVLASAVIFIAIMILGIALYLSWFNNPPTGNNVNVKEPVSSSNHNGVLKRPPIIKAIRSENVEVLAGEPIRFFAEVESPDASELTYHWSASSGNIKGEGFYAMLDTTDISLLNTFITIEVTLRVENDQGQSSDKAVAITVISQLGTNGRRESYANKSDEIIIGDTDSSADAEATVKYLQSGRTRSPVYYVIGRDGKVILVWEEREAAQNSSSTIHIQLAHEIGKERYTQEQLASLINLLVDKVSKSRRLDINKIRTQQEVNPLHHTDLTKSIKDIRETVKGTLAVFSSLGKE